MLQKFLSSVFDQEHQFQDLWELKLIKFDIDLDEDRKPYEKNLAVSTLVEDTKGNPGQKGHFYITNLRLIWHGSTDKDLNLSIGLDTIVNIILKSVPIQGFHDMKYMMIVKALSPRQTKYEFKFAGFTPSQELLFKKVQDVFRKFTDTKLFRTIDTNVRVINNDYRPMENQQIKTRYNDCTLIQNQRQKEVFIILTNIRLIIVHERSSTSNYGIPWIMLQRFSKTEYNNKEALRLEIRGILKDAQLFIIGANRIEFNKMHKQMISFSQSYNKNPTIGIDFSSITEKNDPAVQNYKAGLQVNEIEYTKVNIGRRKNPYSDNNQRGTIRQTFFNEQLGIMMQKFPEGCSRADLWQILRA